MNKETKGLVSDSILTNFLGDFNSDPEPFPPNTSLILLASTAEKKVNKKIALYISKTFDEVLDGFNNSEDEGDILDDIFPTWINFHLQCAYELGRNSGNSMATSFTLATLFGSTLLSKLGGIWNHEIKFPYRFDSLQISYIMTKRSFLHPLNEATTDFKVHFKSWLDEFQLAATVTASNLFFIIRLFEGDRLISVLSSTEEKDCRHSISSSRSNQSESDLIILDY